MHGGGVEAMSPAPISQNPVVSPFPPVENRLNDAAHSSPSPVHSLQFDDIFHSKFMQIIKQLKEDPSASSLTQKDRKRYIDGAYEETDLAFFSDRPLSDHEIKVRALTKVLYKVLAEEPWSDEWIRPHDVERKLSRFELHRDSIQLAANHSIFTPREAIAAARHAANVAKGGPQDESNLRGPYDDIEIIYIPGTVSSTATNKIDRETTYPVSAASVANILMNHICREMTRPFDMAQKLIACTDTEELIRMRQFACDVCDFAPHLLDNDNVSLLVVLLILTRSDICRRFDNNGIRIEGSTISHRKSECMKNKLGWKTADERKPFDNVATELQTRIRNACFPAPRANRANVRKPARKSLSSSPYPGPPIGYYPGPQSRLIPNGGANSAINIPAPPHTALFARPYVPPVNGAMYNGSRPGSSAAEPMELT